MMRIRVVLAEDNLLVREGLRQLLGTVDDIDVVAVCESREELLATIDRERPDAVLTDIRMPPGHSAEGIEVAQRSVTRGPGFQVGQGAGAGLARSAGRCRWFTSHRVVSREWHRRAGRGATP